MGKISVDQPLKPGLVYRFPSLPVINTGDEEIEYGVSIEYHENQENDLSMGLKPEKSWFSFKPERFFLKPGEIKEVDVVLSLPLKGVKPGNYFAYLEVHPFKKEVSGETKIGIAAATKLYFTISPANFLAGIYYRVISLLEIYSPFSYIFLALLIFLIIILIFRRFFTFSFGITIKKREN